MYIRRIIEQEVDKQEWGIELPKYVMLNHTALRLTDKGTYHRDAGKWDVEYRVEGDKVYSVSPVSSVDGVELTPTTKDEWHKQNKDYYFDEKSLGSFDWTSNTYDQNNLGESDEFGWAEKVSGEDFHVGTKFRYFHREYDGNSDNTYEILNIDPSGMVGISVRNIYNDNIKPLTLKYDSVKEGFDSGTYENISVRDTIDTFIYPGSKFIIENAWWEGERDGIRHPREEGRLIMQLTSVDEFGDSKYTVIESDLPIGEPVGSEDVIDINKLRTYIRTDWWEPYNG
jgi:hypothetical protein